MEADVDTLNCDRLRGLPGLSVPREYIDVEIGWDAGELIGRHARVDFAISQGDRGRDGVEELLLDPSRLPVEVREKQGVEIVKAVIEKRSRRHVNNFSAHARQVGQVPQRLANIEHMLQRPLIQNQVELAKMVRDPLVQVVNDVGMFIVVDIEGGELLLGKAEHPHQRFLVDEILVLPPVGVRDMGEAVRRASLRHRHFMKRDAESGQESLELGVGKGQILGSEKQKTRVGPLIQGRERRQ